MCEWSTWGESLTWTFKDGRRVVVVEWIIALGVGSVHGNTFEAINGSNCRSGKDVIVKGIFRFTETWLLPFLMSNMKRNNKKA